MKLNIDNYDLELIYESLEYRIENDEELVLNENVKDSLQDLLRKIEEDNEYL